MKNNKKAAKKLMSQMSLVDTRRQMRAEQISNGTWMGRNTVHKAATDYNRQKTKLETRRLCDGAWR